MLFQKQLSGDVFVKPTEQTKSCFYVIGCHFSECLFTFYLNLIEWYFLFQNLPRKLKIRNFFFSHLFWPLKSFFIQKKYFRTGRKFCLILELSLRNDDIWKTALKKLGKKSWEFSTFLADSREKKKINQSNSSKT